MKAEKLTVRFHASLGRRWNRMKLQGRPRFNFQWRGAFAMNEDLVPHTHRYIKHLFPDNSGGWMRCACGAEYGLGEY